jgi:apolipoprotein N-acyltransferase
VPFGEYVPLRAGLQRVVDLSVLPRDAVAGQGPGILHTPAGDFGVAISYEVFFGERGRAGAASGGDLLLVPTNAASFTSSQVPTQEVAAARLRAWETGRWVLMSAPTGYGAGIDHEGRVLDRTTLSRAEVLDGQARLRTGRTIYVALGDAPVLLVAAVILAGASWWATRRREDEATEPELADLAA